MAYLLYSNFVGDSTGIENSMAYRIAAQKTAYTAALAGIAAQKTRLDAIADDTGIAAALRAACETQDLSLAVLENECVRQEMMALNAAFMSSDTAPRDGSSDLYGSSFDAWWTAVKSGATNTLLTNEFSRVFRRLFGHSSLSAANCSGLTATSFGTVLVTAATTCTLTTVATPIDTTLHGGCLLEIYVTNEFGSETTITLTGVDLNGSAWTGTAIIVAAQFHEGDTTVVTPTIAKTYPVKITACAVTGGTNLDAFTIRSRDPRTLAA